MTLQDHISQRFERLFGEYRKQLSRVRKTGSEDAVHDLRVASRRILETCKVFQGAVDSAAAKRIRKSLKAWMRKSGSVRDLDIALLLAKESGMPDDALLVKRWRERRARRWDRILPALSADRMWKGSTELSTLVPARGSAAQGAVWEYSLTAAQNAALALPLLLDRYTIIGNAIPEGESGESSYHQFRLQTKHIRYTLESFENLYPKEGFLQLLGTLKGFQQVLGLLHDCSVVANLVQKASGKVTDEKNLDDTKRPESERFLEYLACRSQDLRSQWHQRWKEFTQSEAQSATRSFLRHCAGDPEQPVEKRKAKPERFHDKREAGEKAS